MKALLVLGVVLFQHQQDKSIFGSTIVPSPIFTRYLLVPCGASGVPLVGQDDSLRTPVTTSNHPTGLIITVLVGRAPVDTSEVSSWDHFTDVCPLSFLRSR